MKRSVNFDKLIKELETLKSRNQIEKSLNKVADAVNNGDLDPDILCKAKYIRREGSPGHYKYIYAEDQGSGGAKGKQQEKEVNKKTSESNLKYKKGDIVVVPGGKTGKIISYRKDAEHFTVDLGNGVKESYGEKDLKGEPKKESGSKKEEGKTTIKPGNYKSNEFKNKIDNKQLDDFLSKFPDDAQDWSKATNEISDIARDVRKFYNETVLGIDDDDPKALQGLDFKKVKSPSEWNKKGKEYIAKVFNKLPDTKKDKFIQQFKRLFIER